MAKVDYAGTKPGAKKEEKKPEIVMMKCRSPRCDGVQAEVIYDETGNRLYKCTKCGAPLVVGVGGFFPY